MAVSIHAFIALLLASFVWFLKETTAFHVPLDLTRNSHARERTHAARCTNHRLLLRATKEEQHTVINSSINNIPVPPDYPPPSGDIKLDYKLLQNQTEESDAKQTWLERRVADLQAELDDKQNRLNKWALEKTGLVGKIKELQTLLNLRQEEQNEQDTYERERLETEVDLLRTQVEGAMAAWRNEQGVGARLQARLVDLEDSLEFQQMQFAREKKELQQAVREETERLQSIRGNWTRDTKRFEQEKGNMEKELAKEQSRLATAQQEWLQNQREFQQAEQLLREELSQQELNLQARTAELKASQSTAESDRNAFELSLAQENEKLQSVQDTLQAEQARFQKVQAQLETKISQEQQKVQELSDRLERERARFEQEKMTLEQRIDQETTSLQQVQELLEKEQSMFSKMESEMNKQLQEEVRLGKLKKRQMKARYEEIRAEMTALWQAAKRETRDVETKLKAKYQGQLVASSESLNKLETDLSDATATNNELQLVISDLTAQRDAARKATTDTEQRYMTLLAVRNKEIMGINDKLQTLRKTVAAQELELEQYRSSFRHLFRLSGRVTREKFKRSPLAKWIRRDQKTDDNDSSKQS
jgi:chromosome segregation ATPase